MRPPLGPPQPRQHGWTGFPPKCNRTSISLGLTSQSELSYYSILAVRPSSLSTLCESHATTRVPVAWSITMASYAVNAPPSVPLTYIALFGTGALIMRGAGCTINDLWDRSLDNAVGTPPGRAPCMPCRLNDEHRAHQNASPRPRGHNATSGHRVPRAPVDRGARRPHAAELVQVCPRHANLPSPQSRAKGTHPPHASILLGASSLSLVTIYPLMKRVTYWPQAVLGTSLLHPHPLPFSSSILFNCLANLPRYRRVFFWSPIGLAFNWGALLGWSAVAGAVHWPVAVPLYAGGVLWTLVYDSIYAHQDKTDDVRVGIRSTALLFGEHTRSILAAFSASSVGCIALAGYLNAQGAPFFLGTGLAAAQLALIIRRTNFNDRTSCGRSFVACGWVGFWVWMGALGDYIWLQLGANEDDTTSQKTNTNS